MAMRGGSVASYVKIGNFNSPLIGSGQGDVLLALSESELALNRHLLKREGGQIYVNSPEPKRGAVDASSHAEALGSLMSANLVLLGFACGHDVFPLDFETIRQVLKQMSPKRLIESNMNALVAGYDSVHHAQ
jgi:indolepyruvate ferredoxin oxidoreductase beta subunit